MKTKLYSVSEVFTTDQNLQCAWVKADDNMLYGLFSNSFPKNTVVCLLPGNQYTSEFSGHKYILHRVLVFRPNSSDGSIELLAKSKHIFSHLGEFTVKNQTMPPIGVRKSMKGANTPDSEWQDVRSPFTFRVVSTTVGDTVYYNASVENVQWAVVSDIGYYWMPRYNAAGLMLQDDSIHCDLKKVSKPIFAPHKPTKSQLATLEQVLAEQTVTEIVLPM